MSRILTLIAFVLTNSAWGFCDIIEDPPINEGNCDNVMLNMVAPSTSPWTTVFANPTALGLNTSGSLSAAVAVAAESSSLLIGKVLATQSSFVGEKFVAVSVPNIWVEAVLQTQNGSQFVQFTGYQTVAGTTSAIASTSTSAWTATSTTSLDLSYSFANGQLLVKANQAQSKALLGSLSVSNFGQTLPKMLLRRGAAPGVTAANFTVTGWGN